MPKYNVFLARFPYGGVEDYRITDYMVSLVQQLKNDKRIGDIYHQSYNDTPITMTRNRACKDALTCGADLLLMVDNDMVPDYQATEPFWQSSFEYAITHNGPCIIAAPYCGPPPHENIYIFRWRNIQSDHPDQQDFRLEQYTREEAAIRVGFEEVAALPTGLLLMSVPMLSKLPKPWFYYEYKDIEETEKASTEDVTFTRDCSLSGIPIYCNWNAWAGHVKKKVVGKPRILTADVVSKAAQEAVRKQILSTDRMMDVNFKKRNR